MPVLTKKQIKSKLESDESQNFLVSYNCSLAYDCPLKSFVVEKLREITKAPKLSEAKVGGELGILFYNSPFEFPAHEERGVGQYQSTLEAAQQLVRKNLRTNLFTREQSFQMCILLGMDDYEARELFKKMGMTFTNYGILDEIVYEYCLSKKYDIHRCFDLLKGLKAEYDVSGNAKLTLNKQDRDRITPTELARRQTKWIADRYAENAISDASEEEFKEFVREQYPYFHSVRETIIRDLLHILCAPKQIAEFQSERFLFTKKGEETVPVERLSQISYTLETKKYMGQEYVVRFIHNTEVDWKKLASILAGISRDELSDDWSDESVLLDKINFYKVDEGIDDEAALKIIEKRNSFLEEALTFERSADSKQIGKWKYSEKAVKNLVLELKVDKDLLLETLEQLNGPLFTGKNESNRIKYMAQILHDMFENGSRSIPRELLLVSMLLCGYTAPDIYLDEDINGYEPLDVTRKFDALVYEAIAHTKNDKTPLAAFYRLSDNVRLCKYKCCFL